MKRRSFIIGVSTSFLAFPISSGLSQEIEDIEIDGELPPLPADLMASADEPPAPYSDLGAVGSGVPKDNEVAEAYEILTGAPYNTTISKVAEYFLNLGGSKAMYRREWPIRANPVIYHMFSATETKPEGDITPWCAASMNWFILRSRATSKEEIGRSPDAKAYFSTSGLPFSSENIAKYTTHSASSGSFRCWAQTDQPSAGDIVVLADKGTEALSRRCRGTGHVTIFVKDLGNDWVETIGGNQSQKGSNGAITRAKIYVGSGSRFLRYVRIKGA